jgi:hypothetical protein
MAQAFQEQALCQFILCIESRGSTQRRANAFANEAIASHAVLHMQHAHRLLAISKKSRSALCEQADAQPLHHMER